MTRRLALNPPPEDNEERDDKPDAPPPLLLLLLRCAVGAGLLCGAAMGRLTAAGEGTPFGLAVWSALDLAA